MSETKKISKLGYFYIHTCVLKLMFCLTYGHCPNFREVKIVNGLLK